VLLFTGVISYRSSRQELLELLLPAGAAIAPAVGAAAAGLAAATLVVAAAGLAAAVS